MTHSSGLTMLCDGPQVLKSSPLQSNLEVMQVVDAAHPSQQTCVAVSFEAH